MNEKHWRHKIRENSEKLVLVTGGSRGIGQTIARNFLSAGYKVAFTYCKNKELALKTSEAFGHAGCVFELDQANPLSIKKCISAVTDFFCCSVDILINNAAIAQEKHFSEITAEDFTLMLDTNLRGPFLLAQECIPSMCKKSFGKIINISSIGGQWGGINQVHYAASKAGLINLTKSIANVYSSKGVYANAIAVGLVETEMSKAELQTKAGRDKVISSPLSRLGTPEEIANIALFLASTESNYLAGQTLSANGGMYYG